MCLQDILDHLYKFKTDIAGLSQHCESLGRSEGTDQADGSESSLADKTNEVRQKFGCNLMDILPLSLQILCSKLLSAGVNTTTC